MVRLVSSMGLVSLVVLMVILEWLVLCMVVVFLFCMVVV